MYETAAWGKEDQPAFLNQVLILHTEMEPAALMAVILEIEQQMGRSRRERNGEEILISIYFTMKMLWLNCQT